MKTFIRSAFILLALGCGITAHAQATLTTAQVTKLTDTDWKYGTVTCTSPNKITSIIVSMYNNEVARYASSVTPTRTIKSSGKNPETHLYLFANTLTTTEVENFIKGIIFKRTNTIQGAHYVVNVSVDANPTKLPEGGSTITAWDKHPDGSPHYYVWVPSNAVSYQTAYNEAKSYYFQGMRGYLPTITSKEESLVLTNISPEEGWSAGIRTNNSAIIADLQNIPRPDHGNYPIFRWACGPETGFEYYRGPKASSQHAGPMNGAYTYWGPNEPNNDGQYAPNSKDGEYVMQVNQYEILTWNDYNPDETRINGYFIEFGGNGKAYNVGAANYPANSKYIRPTVATTNEQWYLFSPGNEASTSTVVKRYPFRVRAMMLE